MASWRALLTITGTLTAMTSLSFIAVSVELSGATLAVAETPHATGVSHQTVSAIHRSVILSDDYVPPDDVFAPDSSQGSGTR